MFLSSTDDDLVRNDILLPNISSRRSQPDDRTFELFDGGANHH